MTDTRTRPDSAPAEQSDDSPKSISTKPLATRKTPRVGKSFSSRNPTPIGAIGLVFILVLLFAAFNADSLPLIGGGTTYNAMFSTSADLQEDDDVVIAGVRVGQVDTVAVDRDRGLVKVAFKIKSGWIGNESTASIKIRTLLGAKDIEIDSQGTKAMKAGATIPVSHTSSPLDVYPAFTALTNTVDSLNKSQLANALNTLSGDFSNTPKSVRPVVTGISRLSRTISSRDGKLRTLLARTKDVTGVLATRSSDLQRLLRDGNLLLAELTLRRNAIHQLFLNTQTLSTQLTGLVHDNQKTLNPLLASVNRVLALLRNNQDSLNRGLSLLGPFYRVFNNVVGNGRWFDNYIQNLSLCGIIGQALPVGC